LRWEELTGMQFVCACATGRDPGGFVPVDGHCRLCGGRLYRDEGFGWTTGNARGSRWRTCEVPQVYTACIGDTWNSEFLTRARDSRLLCPACAWGYSQARFQGGPKGRVYAPGIGLHALADWRAVVSFLSAPGAVVPPGVPFVLLVVPGRSALQPFRAVVNWGRDPVAVLWDGKVVLWVSPPEVARLAPAYGDPGLPAGERPRAGGFLGMLLGKFAAEVRAAAKGDGGGAQGTVKAKTAKRKGRKA